jgi:hypothetical protein
VAIDAQEFLNRYGRTPSSNAAPGDRGFKMTFDTAKFASIIDDINVKVAKAVRPAAQAGAQVLHDEVVSNVDRMLGKRFIMRGVLREAVYQAFMDKRSGDLESYYRISWNKTKAPHGHLVEYGHLLTYEVYFGRDGKYHTRIKAGKLKEWLAMKAGGMKSIPKSRRDEFYIRHPAPKQVAARPFVRAAASKFDQALGAAKDKFFAEINLGT